MLRPGLLILIRFDSSGNPKWVQTAGSHYADGAGYIVLDSLNNIYISGSYSNNKLWVVGIGDQGEDGGGFIGLNKAQNQLFVSGVMQFGNVNFGGTTLSDNNEFFYVADLKDINTRIEPSFGNNQLLHVFPNPSNDFINISLDGGLPVNSIISLYDMTGKEILKMTLENNQKTINLNKVPPGMYVVTVTYHNGIARQKIEVR